MSGNTYQVQPGPPVQLSGSPIPVGSLVINNDPTDTVWVSTVPTVSPGNGMPIAPLSATNWNPLQKGGTFWACVDSGVLTPISITVTDDANTYTNPVGVAQAQSNIAAPANAQAAFLLGVPAANGFRNLAAGLEIIHNPGFGPVPYRIFSATNLGNGVLGSGVSLGSGTTPDAVGGVGTLFVGAWTNNGTLSCLGINWYQQRHATGLGYDEGLGFLGGKTYSMGTGQAGTGPQLCLAVPILGPYFTINEIAGGTSLFFNASTSSQTVGKEIVSNADGVMSMIYSGAMTINVGVTPLAYNGADYFVSSGQTVNYGLFSSVTGQFFVEWMDNTGALRAVTLPAVAAGVRTFGVTSLPIGLVRFVFIPGATNASATVEFDIFQDVK